MRTFFAGEVVPVAIEQMSKDLRLDLARCRRRVAVRITFIACGKVGGRDRRTIRIDSGGKNNGVPVGRPKGVIGLGGDAGELLRVAGRACSRIEGRRPNLLTALSTGKEEQGAPVGGKLHAGVSRLGDGNLLRGLVAVCWARDGLDKPLRGFDVLVEIYRGNSVGEPLAVGRDGGCAQPLHLHQVFKGDGPLGGRGRGLGRAEDGEEGEGESKGDFAHDFSCSRGEDGNFRAKKQCTPKRARRRFPCAAEGAFVLV